jgi:hypothetical protein
MSDRLHDTLTTLRPDVERAALADSAAVRRRGNQRTRRQAAGSALAAVAIVAAAVGVASGLNGDDRAIDQLPATHAPTTSATVQRAPADVSVLLAVTDLPAVPHQTFMAGETLAKATTAELAQRHLTVCGISPAGGPAISSALLRTFPSDLDAFAWEWVATYGSAGEAEAALAGLRDRCTAAKTTITPLSGLPAGGDGFRATTFGAPAQSELHGELNGIVRVDNTIVVVSLRGMLKDGDVDATAFDIAVASAATSVASH